MSFIYIRKPVKMILINLNYDITYLLIYEYLIFLYLYEYVIKDLIAIDR